ncbi:uncharacterized protein [Diadema antillarum]|uniref:uncharacterized protein n=1 Tax=Diadema antillarum TaxID=105358 RepID=UPI003A85E96D
MEYLVRLLIAWMLLVPLHRRALCEEEELHHSRHRMCPSEIDGAEAPVNVDNKHELDILGFFPLEHSGHMYNVGNSSYVSACLAVQHVNSDRNILRDYHLNLIGRDSMNDEGFAINILFDELYNDIKPKLFVIGGLRNEITESLAKPLAAWDILQVTTELTAL